MSRIRLVRLGCAMALTGASVVGPAFAWQPQPPPEQISQPASAPMADADPLLELTPALVRLPLAALLGAALALRPRRRGTPARQAAVVETQIMLAVVGAVIMLVVGASLARAFGIVGVASLIRYRSKIEDPKDASVMLCALGVGLAAGVGLYGLAAFSTAFMVLSLGIIESFEPRTRKHFMLSVKAGQGTDELKPRIEAVLDRFGSDYELRASADEEVCYDVRVPLEVQTDAVSNAILVLDPTGHAAVEWLDQGRTARP